MKLEELMRMPSTASHSKHRIKTGATVPGPGRGRNNQSTGHRGIVLRTDRTRSRRSPYQVFTRTTPATYIGCTKTLDEALELQAGYVPVEAPRDCSGFPGVIWTSNSYRARVTVDGELYQRRGFTSPEDATAWIEEIRREHKRSK